jgi:hypothetical protein
MSTSNATAEVFVYIPGGERVPDDVVRVRVDPSVTSIPAKAFYHQDRLAEVELCEGLVEIGADSFRWCDHSITKINIPTSLRRINDEAFIYSLRTPIRLHDDIESIGQYAFTSCIFTNFRVPPLITVIPEFMLSHCRSMFSLELPEDVTEINKCAFYYCYCLRNVAFPPNATVFGDAIINVKEIHFISDLQELFGSGAAIMRELQHRFDGLPIHRLVYYQSYHWGMLQMLIAAVDMRSSQRRTLRSKLDPTGNQQDCLGMTPLHILTCSSVHDLELYRVIVENYPTNLITQDRWGALPLLYAFWGAAPNEIVQFLLKSYKSFHPGHVFDWTMMVETMGRCDTPKESIEKLLSMKQMHFPEQPLNWGYLLENFAHTTKHSFGGLPFQERMRYLFMCGLSDRVEALAFKGWRESILNRIHAADFKWAEDGRHNSVILHRIQAKIAHFEDKLLRLKEITTILELALWKISLNENNYQEEMVQRQKKIKADKSSMRRHCRIICGADVLIGHVLPYLITVVDEESDSDSESTSSSHDESTDIT